MLSPWLRRLLLRSGSPVRTASRRIRPTYYPRAEILEDRLAPATFAWTGLGGIANFNNPNNWLNASTNAPGTPGNGDSLLFPNGGPSGAGTVTDNLPGLTTFNSITFLSAGWTIAAGVGSTVGVTSAITDATNIAGTNTISAPVSFATASSSVGVNVVNPRGAAFNNLTLSNTVDLGGAGLTYTGFGDLSLTGVVSNSAGSGGIAVNSSSTLTLNGANTYTGATTISSGIVTVTNATSLGTGTITVNNGGSLNLLVTGVSNALNLNGLGFGGNGALIAGGNNLVYAGAITLQTNSSINVGAGINFILSGNAAQTATGTISGSGGLTVVGPNSATLTDEDMGTYTGVTNILGPAFALFSAPGQAGTGGQNTGTFGYVVSQGGILASSNTNVVTNNRISLPGTAFVELDGGALDINVTAGASTETFAALNLGNAAPGIIGSNTVNLGPNNNTVTVGTLNRFAGSTVTFSGTNFGTGNNFTPLAFGAGAVLVNGILPYANVSIGGGPNTFVTDVTPGTTPLTIAVPTTTINANTTTNFASANTNLLVTGAITLTLNANSTINSLALANGAIVNLAGFSLTINSGAILTESNNTDFIATSAVGGALRFQNTTPAAVEGIIQNPAGALNLDASSNTVAITAGNNLTLAVTALNFTGTTVVNSTYTGTTFVSSGTVFLNDTAVANVIPTPLVIGTGGQAAIVSINTNFQQLGTAAAPDDVTVNAGGTLSLGGGISQTIGNLTLNSGLTSARASIGAGITLTVTGTITSGGVTLSPTAGLAGGIPTVSNFQPSLISGGFGSLVILAPGGNLNGGTTIFNVGKTPAIVGGGEQDLQISSTIGGVSNTTLDKQGAGVLVINAVPNVSYTGIVQIDGGTFASGVAGFAQNITVNASGTLGSASAAAGLTTGAITVNGGAVNPGLPPSPLVPSNSQNALYQNTGTATTPNFSAGGILALHIDAYGNAGTDFDQFQGTANANQVTLGGTSILDVDLLGLAQSGLLTGANSTFTWANPLIGRFSDAPNALNNILPAANVLNNPTGFQVIVSYGMGFISVSIGHPPTVSNSTYTTTAGTALTVNSRGAGVLATLTDPDFIGAESEAFLDGVANPGTLTGSAGGTLVVNGDGTFTYTPKAGFTGTESFTLTAVTPRGAVSTPFTVSFSVTPATPPPTPPTPPPGTLPINYVAVGADAGGGPQVSVYNSATNGVVSVFYAFTPTFTGGVRVAVDDINGDGVQDIIAAAGPGGGPQVIVIDGTKLSQLQSNGQIANSALITSFYAFNAPTFTGGVFVAAGTSSSGQNWVVVGAGAGTSPQVTVYTAKALVAAGFGGTPASIANFYAFTPTFSGGVSVAVGDVLGNGKLDVIAGAGPSGGPQVIVVDGTKFAQVQSGGQIANSALLASFYAFNPSFTGGVFVSGGVFGGQFNVIVGAGAGGGPEVIAVNGSQLTQLQSNGQIANSALLANFFALPSGFTGGVRVGFDAAFGPARKAAILTAAGPSGSPEVNIVDALSQKSLGAFFLLPISFAGGAFVSG